MQPDQVPVDRHRKVQSYYRRVAPFLERELSARGDESFWKAVVREPSVDSALEIGVGTGRISAILAPFLRRLVGIDLSLPLLRKAAASIGTLAQVHLMQADACEFAVATRFDLVLGADDPFAHLLDGVLRDRAFESVALHLKRSGSFILDALWFPGDPKGGSFSRRHRSLYEDGKLEVLEQWSCHTASRRCDVSYQYRYEGETVQKAGFRGRYWTFDEVVARARKVGLRIDRIWGDYDQRPWTSDSPHMIVRMKPATGSQRR